MKIFILSTLVTLMTALVQMNGLKADPVFFEMPLSVMAKKQLLSTVGDKVYQNNKILFIGLQDSTIEEKLEHKGTFEVIVAYHPSLTRLKQIEEALQSGGTAYIVYFPRESFHWQLLEHVVGEERFAEIATHRDYQQAIEKLDVSLIQAILYRDFAIYKNKEEFLLEVKKDRILWGSEINKKELNTLLELAKQQSMLYSENEKIVIPYKMLNIILIKN